MKPAAYVRAVLLLSLVSNVGLALWLFLRYDDVSSVPGASRAGTVASSPASMPTRIKPEGTKADPSNQCAKRLRLLQRRTLEANRLLRARMKASEIHTLGEPDRDLQTKLTRILSSLPRAEDVVADCREGACELSVVRPAKDPEFSPWLQDLEAQLIAALGIPGLEGQAPKPATIVGKPGTFLTQSFFFVVPANDSPLRRP